MSDDSDERDEREERNRDNGQAKFMEQMDLQRCTICGEPKRMEDLTPIHGISRTERACEVCLKQQTEAGTADTCSECTAVFFIDELPFRAGVCINCRNLP